MSYDALLLSEAIKSQFLAVICPARLLESLAAHGGGVYSQEFTFGVITSVAIDGVQLTEVAAVPTSNNTFFYNYPEQKIYIRTDGTAPSGVIVATYEIYVGTIDAHWHRIPTDDTSTIVYYEPLIQKTPDVQQSLNDALLGYMPVQSSILSLSNVLHIFERHLFDGSLYNRNVYLYHCLAEQGGGTFRFDVDNIKLVSSGLMSNIKSTPDTVDINLVDRIDVFAQEYRPPAPQFFNKTDFPLCIPTSVGKPIRSVYGVVDELYVTNVDHKVQGATTSDNRKYVVRGDGSNLHFISAVVQSGGTTTRTFLDSVVGIQVDDSVHFNGGATNYYGIVTAVGSNYIDHTAITAAAGVGTTVDRSTIGNVFLVAEGNIHRPLYNRDYIESVVSGTLALEFRTTLEANLGISNPLSGSEKIYVRCYGKKNNVQMGGSALGTDDAALGNLTNAGVILFDLLVNRLGLSENEINTHTISNLVAENIPVGFALPERQSGNLPIYKDVLGFFSSTLMLRTYLDELGKWAFEQVAPFNIYDVSVDKSEIVMGTYIYTLEYTDAISTAIVDYRYREQSDATLSVSSTSDHALYFTNVKKQKTFKTYLLNESDATDLARRYMFFYEDRLGKVSINAKYNMFQTLVSDKMRVTRDDLIGYDYVKGTSRERNFRILNMQKGLTETKIEASDDARVNKNSASW